MTTVDGIIAFFCQVDDHLSAIPTHPEAHLCPSEVVTFGRLHARTGVGNRACDRWLTRDSRALTLLTSLAVYRAWSAGSGRAIDRDPDVPVNGHDRLAAPGRSGVGADETAMTLGKGHRAALSDTTPNCASVPLRHHWGPRVQRMLTVPLLLRPCRGSERTSVLCQQGLPHSRWELVSIARIVMQSLTRVVALVPRRAWRRRIANMFAVGCSDCQKAGC